MRKKNNASSRLKHGKFMKDSMVLGSVAGLIGTSLMVLSNQMIYNKKKTEIRYGNIAGSIFMKPHKTKKPKNFLLGQIFHFANGSAIGVLLVELYKKYGTDYSLLKGAMVGMATWEILYTGGQRIGIYSSAPHLTKTGYSAIWNNLVYGISTSYAIRWLAHPSVFAETNKAYNQASLNRVNNMENKLIIEENIQSDKQPKMLH